VTEKRKHPRYVVEGLGIYARTIFNTEVEMLDISVSGGSVRVTKRFVIGNEYIFKFERGVATVSVKGSVVWEKLSGTRKIGEGEAVPVYTVGIKFMNGLDCGEMETIRNILVDKAKERKLGGMKVQVFPPGKAVLSYFETCRVRDVSLGGMRIETEQEPSVNMIFPLELILAEGEEPISCKGPIAFYQESPEGKRQGYTAGVEFMDMSDADKSRLGRFIEILPADIGETP
jgi:hypothetical protein